MSSGGSCSLGSGTSSSICSSSGPSDGAGMLEKQITSLGHKLDIVEKLPQKVEKLPKNMERNDDLEILNYTSCGQLVLIHSHTAGHIVIALYQCRIYVHLSYTVFGGDLSILCDQSWHTKLRPKTPRIWRILLHFSLIPSLVQWNGTLSTYHRCKYPNRNSLGNGDQWRIL